MDGVLLSMESLTSAYLQGYFRNVASSFAQPMLYNFILVHFHYDFHSKGPVYLLHGRDLQNHETNI